MEKENNYCDLLKSCVFFKKHMNTNLEQCRLLVADFCRGKSGLECQRKALRLKGTKPSDEMLPNGQFLDESKLACKFIKKCKLLITFENKKALFCETLKNKHCRTSNCTICKRYIAMTEDKEISDLLLPDGTKFKV